MRKNGFLLLGIWCNGYSIPGPVIPKTQKWHLISPCFTLKIISDGSRVRGAIK